jgi:hypothetical protein
MSDLKELNQFLKEYGKDGMKLLVLFSLLKSKAKATLKPYPGVDEKRLNRVCMAKANELLRLGKDQPTEKDIEELLSRLKTH